MKPARVVLVAMAVLVSNSVFGAGSATVHLDGGNFIQSGSVLNTSTPGVDIVSVVYDLGAHADNIAIWEINSSTGTHSNFLTGDWYSTETWNSLSVSTGNTFTFSGLDIDLIETVVPPVVTSATIGGPSSLANASVTVFFSDNTWGTAQLVQQDWQVDQNLRIGVTAVPEPETYAMMLAGLGLLGFAARRRKRQAA